jgi:hypothetical protein
MTRASSIRNTPATGANRLPPANAQEQQAQKNQDAGIGGHSHPINTLPPTKSKGNRPSPQRVELPGFQRLAVGALAFTALARGAVGSGEAGNRATSLLPLGGLQPSLSGDGGTIAPAPVKQAPQKPVPAPGIPYISNQGLRAPLERLVHEMLSHVGQKDGNPAEVREHLFKVRRDGQPPQLDPKLLQQAMKEYKPEVIDAAMTLSSFCGAQEQKIEDALKRCLNDVVKRCISLDSLGNSVEGTRKEDCDPYTSLSGRMPALANVARLAVLKATREIDHRYTVPILQGPPAVAEAWGGALAVGEIAAVPNMPTRLGTLIMTDEAALAANGGHEDLSIVKALVHEMFHALTDDRFDEAIQNRFPRHWNPIREFATEFVASHFVTHNATDSPYEQRDGGNHFMLRVAETLTKTSPLTEQAYGAGVYAIKKALIAGDPSHVARFCDAVNGVIKAFGPPVRNRPIGEPASAAPLQTQADPSSTSQPAEGEHHPTSASSPSKSREAPSDSKTTPTTTPPVGGSQPLPAPALPRSPKKAGKAIAALLAAGGAVVGAEAVRRRMQRAAPDTAASPARPRTVAVPPPEDAADGAVVGTGFTPISMPQRQVATSLEHQLFGEPDPIGRRVRDQEPPAI